jgi:hypothetical protein
LAVDILKAEQGKENKQKAADETKTSKIILIGASTLFGNDQQLVIESKHLAD